jgi:hypothetical protein
MFKNSVYSSQKILHLHHKTNWLILFGEIISVSCENCTDHFIFKILAFNVSVVVYIVPVVFHIVNKHGAVQGQRCNPHQTQSCWSGRPQWVHLLPWAAHTLGPPWWSGEFFPSFTALNPFGSGRYLLDMLLPGHISYGGAVISSSSFFDIR